MNIATVEQTIDEIMGWDDDGNYNLPPKEEGIAYATAKAVQILPDLIAELKRCYEEIDYLNALTNNLPVEMLVEAEQKLQASE